MESVERGWNAPTAAIRKLFEGEVRIKRPHLPGLGEVFGAVGETPRNPLGQRLEDCNVLRRGRKVSLADALSKRRAFGVAALEEHAHCIAKRAVTPEGLPSMLDFLLRELAVEAPRAGL
jgi:hypothetical protein